MVAKHAGDTRARRATCRGNRGLATGGHRRMRLRANVLVMDMAAQELVNALVAGSGGLQRGRRGVLPMCVGVKATSNGNTTCGPLRKSATN